MSEPTIPRTALVQALEFLGLDGSKITWLDATHHGMRVKYLDDTATDLDEVTTEVYYTFV